MTTVHLPRQILRGSRELQSFDMIPAHSAHDYHTPNTTQMSTGQHNTFRKPIMNDSITPNMALKTTGCKDDLNAHKIIRRPPMDPMKGIYPQVGRFRHEKKGLAYDPAKPLNTPLMPMSSNFFAGINNTIPQPK
jgi:hypothetical protein